MRPVSGTSLTGRIGPGESNLTQRPNRVPSNEIDSGSTRILRRQAALFRAVFQHASVALHEWNRVKLSFCLSRNDVWSIRLDSNRLSVPQPILSNELCAKELQT
jgi:hypothetical protein